MAWDPAKDGIDHTNVYSQGKTKLGQWLSNFAYSPLDLPEGRFNSIEGYWYYLGCAHPEKDRLKRLYGFQAKQTGRALRGSDVPMDCPDFKEKIQNALRAKLATYPEYSALLKENTLPLAHYYVFKGKVVEPKEFQWVIDVFREEQL